MHLGACVTRVLLLTSGPIWLFVLSMLIVRREEGDLQWATVKLRLRLNTPRDPATGESCRTLWLWSIPLVLVNAELGIALTSHIERLWVSAVPFFTEPQGYGWGALFESQQTLDRLVGAWWFLALIVFGAVRNTILREEFIFRGMLLPGMEGVFGRWSWAADGVLFGFYPLHQPRGILTSVIDGALLSAFPSWRFRSTWMGVIVHSSQSVYSSFLILGVVLGLG